jgi:hypothetical protein
MSAPAGLAAGATVMLPAADGVPAMPLDTALAAVYSPDDAARNHVTRGITAMKTAPALLAAGLIYVSDATVSEVRARGLSEGDLQHAISHADPYVRQCAGVLFRRFFTAEEVEDVLWILGEDQGFGLAPRSAIKEALLLRVPAEPEDAVAKIITTIVGDIALMEMDHEMWPELLPKLFDWLTSASATNASRIAALRVLESLTMFVAEKMRADFGTLVKIYAGLLSDPSCPTNVKLQAARTASTLLAWLNEGDSSLSTMAPLAPLMLHFAGGLVASGHNNVATEAIAMMLDIAADQATFFKPVLSEAVSGMLTVADTASIPDKVRRLALEFVVVLGECAPGLVRKIPGNRYVTQVLPVLLSTLVRVDSEADPGWDAREEVTESDPVTAASLAADQIRRLGMAVGPGKTLPVLYPMISAALSHSDWHFRLAALKALGAAASTHPPTRETDDLRGMADKMCRCGADSHPRVRHAVAESIGLWCYSHGPHFQMASSDLLLPALGALLRDGHPRVQAQACYALQEFMALDFPDRIVPHAPALVSQLATLLATGGRTVREYSLRSVAVLCECAGEAIEPSYAHLYGLLRALADNPLAAFAAAGRAMDTHDLRQIRGKACDAMSHLFVAVRRDTCVKDIPDALSVLGKAATEVKGADDPLTACVWEALARLAQALPQDTAAVLPVLIPALVSAASQKIESVAMSKEQSEKFREEAEEEAEEGAAAEPEFVLYDDPTAVYGLRVRRVAIEEKSMAMELLTRLVHGRALDGGLVSYAPSILKPVVTALADRSDAATALREHACELCSDLVLMIAVGASRAGCTSAAVCATVAPVVRLLFAPLLPALCETGKRPETETAVIAAIKNTLLEGCLERATDGRAVACVAQGETSTPGSFAPSHLTSPSGHLHHAQSFLPVLAPEVLGDLVTAIVRTIRESFAKEVTKTQELKVRADEFDEEALEDAQHELAIMQDTQSALVDLLCTVARTHGELGVKAVEANASSLLADELLAPGASPHRRKLAVFVIDDILEFTGAVGVSRLAGFIPILWKELQAASEDMALAQAAAYGIGAAAQTAGPAFSPYAAKSLSLMWDLVRAVRPASSPENEALVALAGMGATGFPAPDTSGKAKSGSAMSDIHGLVDNTLSAIGKVLHFAVAPVGSAGAAADVADARAQLFEWAARMPLASDLIESRTATEVLCERLSGNCPFLAAASAPALARSLQAVSWALQMPKVCCPFVLRAATNASKALAANHPTEFAAAWATIPPRMQGPLEGAEKAALELAPPLPAPAPAVNSAPLALPGISPSPA